DSILSSPVLMNLETSTPLIAYLQSMKYVNEFRDKFSIILSGHDHKSVDPVVLDELINGVSDILSGKIKGQPTKTRFGDALMCKFSNTAIIYKESSL
ncbi:MAG TPA: hypothetical protein VMC48_00590, partial [Methanobacterium sp.]|nr:hypothetical protein [Methanobacterium sp.]